MRFIEFREIQPSDAELLLRWRCSPEITRFMNSDIEYNLEKQKQWIESSYQKPDYYHWLIEIEKQPAGFINISEYNSQEKTTSWGFYLGEDKFKGMGAFIPPNLYNFLFKDLRLKKVYAEVMEDNAPVLGMHKLHGYQFTPERNRRIYKKDKEIQLLAMELKVTDWNFTKYRRLNANFPTQLWKAANEH